MKAILALALLAVAAAAPPAPAPTPARLPPAPHPPALAAADPQFTVLVVELAAAEGSAEYGLHVVDVAEAQDEPEPVIVVEGIAFTELEALRVLPAPLELDTIEPVPADEEAAYEVRVVDVAEAEDEPEQLARDITAEPVIVVEGIAPSELEALRVLPAPLELTAVDAIEPVPADEEATYEVHVVDVAQAQDEPEPVIVVESIAPSGVKALRVLPAPVDLAAVVAMQPMPAELVLTPAAVRVVDSADDA